MMQYTTYDGIILTSIAGQIVSYTCITDIADGIYESYESSVIDNELVIIKIVRTVNNFETTYEITQLTQQEIQDYFESTKPPLPEPIPFDWDAYKQQLNEIQEEWFLNIITADPYEYSSFYELSLWVTHPTYDNEARLFIKLWWDSWDVLTEHLSTVTEETADIQIFINKLNDLYGN
jgi:hypothetical protein